MATEVKQPEANVTRTTEERVVHSTQQFWSKNSKFLVFALIAIVVLIGGWFAYQRYVKTPAEQAAFEAIWPAQENFKIDSFSLALNGNNTKANPGFLKIIREHGNTKAGNLAKFYAGSCYLQLGDFKNAIKHLDDFSTDQPELALRKAGSLGDAYAELGQNDKAVEQYRKASTTFEDDEINSSEYLFRLGQLYDKMNKPNDAVEALKSLREKYPASMRARDAEKYLAKLGEVGQ
jgi:predicted negative regulator of RcsB-dependent stress response